MYDEIYTCSIYYAQIQKSRLTTLLLINFCQIA